MVYYADLKDIPYNIESSLECAFRRWFMVLTI